MRLPFLKLTGITKQYPGVTALREVDFSVNKGEVVALVGENGAGKSTLMKILGGVTQPTAGAIEVDGVAFDGMTVGQSMDAGISFVHQELNLFENLSVAANIFMGREALFGGALKLVNTKALNTGAQSLLDLLGADFRADASPASLSLAQRQMVEIAKALSVNARLVIMDEPTSSFTASETQRLLALIAKLKKDGISFVYISHRLSEIERLADRAVVLRDGRQVAELTGQDINGPTLIRHMIGRELKALYTKPGVLPGTPVLELIELRTPFHPDQSLNLSLAKGEILGVAGLIGSGRTELAQTLFGLDRRVGGEIRVEGKAVEFADARAAIESGVYLVPEDRKRNGIILDFPIKQNISLATLGACSRHGLVSAAKENKLASVQKERLDIRASDLAIETKFLSGGNQQKVVLAKWLSMQPRVIIFDEPTRGIDVGAISEIYGLMRQLADRGVGVMMISSDLEEVIGVSDRVVVMHEGRLAGELAREELSEAAIVSLAVGRGVA